MKRFSEIVKPFSAIVFGALFFMLYFNYLAAQGEALAIGIVATIISVYYLAAGIIAFVAGDKLPETLRKVFDIISISAFPLFMFVYYLLFTIRAADAIGPAGWIIVVISIGGSISAAIICALARAIDNALLRRLGYLFAAIFALVLVTNLIFWITGDAKTIAEITIVELVIDILFISMLFASFPKEEKASE